MNEIKYVAFDVHKSNIVVAVVNLEGKTISQAIIETQPSAIRDFLRGLSGSVHLTFEEGSHSQWLFDLARPLVSHILVCDPRQNLFLKAGNKSDKIDASKLALLLRAGLLKEVYHGHSLNQTLKQLVHSYDSLTSDTTRLMNRIKALFRSRAIACCGRDVYYKRNRAQWLDLLLDRGLRLRAEFLYTQLDLVRSLRRDAKKAMLREASKEKAFKLLGTIPGLGPVRVSQLLASIGSPFRFQTSRQLWSYCGLGVVTRSSADYELSNGEVRRRQKAGQTRGLNRNYNHRLKVVFKSAAIEAMKDESIRNIYERQVKKGIRPEMARLTIARKLVAVSLAIWKKEEEFDPEKMTKLVA
jgi:transposase